MLRPEPDCCSETDHVPVGSPHTNPNGGDVVLLQPAEERPEEELWPGPWSKPRLLGRAKNQQRKASKNANEAAA